MGRSIVPNLARYEVWFLTGSQTLYGDEVLAQVARQSQGVVEHLANSPFVPADVVWKPVLTSRGAIERIMREANAAENVIGVITWMHTFSPAKMWIAGLQALTKPLLHLHTQANVELPWATIDFDFMNLNQAAHGDREYAYIESRLGVPRTTVVGHASHRRVQEQVGEWARAAAGVLASRNMRVARFGDNMRFVAVTEGDKTEAEAVFGAQINTWGVMDLAARVDAATNSQVDALIEEYVDSYDVATELMPGGVRYQSLRDGAAIEVGLRSFLDEGAFHAFTTTFEDLGTLRQLPGLAVQRLMADGYGFGAEGDWKTAMLVRIAAVMGAGRPGRCEPHGGLHLPLGRGRGAVTRGAHARGEPLAHLRAPDLGGASPEHRRQGGPGPPRVHRRPGRRRRGRPVATCATGSGWSPRRLRGSRSRRRCRTFRSVGRSGGPSRTSRPRPPAGWKQGRRITR